MRDGTYERRIDDARLQEIRDYYQRIPIEKFTESSAGEIVPLPMQGIQDQEPLPPKFVKARRDIPRLMDFIDAVALYHYSDRMIIEDDYPQKLLVAPVDAWHGFKIFGENLIMSALILRAKNSWNSSHEKRYGEAGERFCRRPPPDPGGGR